MFIFTFCDGGDPQIIKDFSKEGSIIQPMIKWHDENEWFIKVNNSQLYEQDTKSSPFTKLFWDLTQDGLKKLCKRLVKSEPRSLDQVSKRLKDLQNFQQNQKDLTAKFASILRYLVTFFRIRKELNNSSPDRWRQISNIRIQRSTFEQNISFVMKSYPQSKDQINIQKRSSSNEVELMIIQHLLEGQDYENHSAKLNTDVDENRTEYENLGYDNLAKKYLDAASQFDKDLQIHRGVISEENEYFKQALITIEQKSLNDGQIEQTKLRRNRFEKIVTVVFLIHQMIESYKNTKPDMYEDKIAVLVNLDNRYKKVFAENTNPADRLAFLIQQCKQGIIDEELPKESRTQWLWRYRMRVFAGFGFLFAVGVIIYLLKRK
jgi:hypothetical protein